MPTTPKWLKPMIVLTALAVSSATQAGTLWCTGTVAEIGVHLPNQLLVRLSTMNDRAVMCFLDAAYNTPGQLGGTISAATCKSMYVNLLAARASGQAVQMMMDGDQVPAQCNSFVSWSYVSLRYVSNGL